MKQASRPILSWPSPAFGARPAEAARTRSPGTSHGVSSPSALAGPEQLVAPELPTSDLPARMVSHRITPCTPSRSVPALFHAGSALGVAPCRALIPLQVRAPLGARYPLVVAVPSQPCIPCWNPDRSGVRADRRRRASSGTGTATPLSGGRGRPGPWMPAEPRPRRSSWRRSEDRHRTCRHVPG
jgi:hypothetical protein